MIINIILLILYLTFVSVSVIGYGKLTIEYLKIKNDFFNIGEILLLGFFSLFGISILLHFFVELNQILNLIVISIGFFYFLLKFNNLKKLFFFKNYFYYLVFLILIPSIIVIRTHADYEWYHLPYINYVNNFKIIFGLANFSNNLAFGHGWQDILSLFNLPFVKTRGLTSLGMIFYFAYLISLIKYIEEINSINIKLIVQVIFIFSLATFNKLIDFGAESQALMLMILFGLNTIFFTDKKNDMNILKILFYFIFSLFLRVGSIVFIPTFIIILIFNFKLFYNYISNNMRPFIFTLFILILLFSRNFIHSGCLIFPLPSTCFFNENLEWSVPIDIVKERYYVQSAKAKGLQFYINESGQKDHLNFYFKKIQNGTIKHPKEYSSDVLLWSKYWFLDHDKNRVLNIFILITISSVLLLISKKNKIIRKNNKNEYLLLITLILSSFCWFYVSPQTRYGGIAIISLAYVYFLYLFFFKYNYYKDKLNLIFKTLIIIPLVYISFKNYNRLSNLDFNQFQKFPFPNYNIYKPNKDYINHSINGLNINLKKHEKNEIYGEPIRCGDIKMICIPEPLKICVKEIKFKKNYIFVSNTNINCLKQYKNNYWQH